MDQPTTRPAEHVWDDRAVHLWFPGWVFCHVGHPKAVGFVTGEVAVDQVRGSVQGADPPSAASAPAEASKAGSSHEHRHRIMAHCYPIAEPQLRMDRRAP